MNTSRLVVGDGTPCTVCQRATFAWLLLVTYAPQQVFMCETCRALHAHTSPILLGRPASPWPFTDRHPLAPYCRVERNGVDETPRCQILTADEASGYCTARHVGEEKPWTPHPDYDVITDLPWAVVRVVVQQ